MANEARIIRRSLADLKSEKDQTDWARVDALSDEEIDAAIADDPDAAPIVDAAWFAEAAKRLPNKKQITLRLDEDVIEFFPAGGRPLPDPHERGPPRIHAARPAGQISERCGWSAGLARGRRVCFGRR